MTESPAIGQLTHGFLFADLRGFTAYAEARGDRAAAELLDRYFTLVRTVIRELGGAEIKTEGDSFYVVFPSASRAVAAGLAIVAAASRANVEEPDRPLLVGVGIHAGEAEERPQGFVGTAVNLAARVCAQATAGEVLVSDTVRSLTRTSGRYRFTSRGRPTLKGIAEPIALYRVELVRDPAAAALPSRRRPALPLRTLLAAIVALLTIAAAAALLNGRNVPRETESGLGAARGSGSPVTASPSGTPESTPSSTPSPLAALKLLWETSGPSQPTPCCTYWPAIDPKTGDIWVADSFESQYWIFTSGGRFVETWGRPGTGPGQFDFDAHRSGPQAAGAIAFAPDGSFFVADVGNHRVQKFDAKRGFVKEWGSFGAEDGQFAEPFGIATDGKTVYVGDDDRGDIQAFDLGGRFLRKFGNGIFIALDPAGNVYASSPRAITKYDQSGKLVAAFDVAAGGGVAGLAIDGDGDIFANIQSDVLPNAPLGLVELDATGKQIRAWSTGGETIALDPQGDAIYLANFATTGWPTASLRKYALPLPSSLTMYHGGPDRTGLMPGPGPTGKPSVAWNVARGGGIPFSIMPLVANGRVIVADASGTLAALDEQTGVQLWNVGLGSAIRSSPVLVNGLVVAGSNAGTLVGVRESDGIIAWQKSLVGDAISASLLAADGGLYVGSENGSLYRVDPKTGEQVWSVDLGGPITRGPAYADGVIYVGATGGRFSAIEVATQGERWSVELGPGQVGTPTIGNGLVYVGRGLLAAGPPHDLVALDLRDGSFSWHFESPTGQQVHAGGLANGVIYGVSEDGKVYALDATTGDRRWTAGTDGSIGTLAGLVENVVYVSSSDQTVRAFDARTGEELWRVEVQGTPTMPAVIDGRVIVGTSLGRVVAIVGSP